MKIFLDTNIWVRLFVAEDTPQRQLAKKLLEAIEAGEYAPYTSTIVCLEVAYVLRSVYKLSPHVVHQYVDAMLATRTITLIEKTNFIVAWKLHKASKLKLSDCLIVTQVPKTAKFCTFDQELKSQFEKIAVVPKELLL